ncbi:16S rRNA (uracil(1498)-N(3))-methyltransferase [Zhouia sp. PK063]|uniref:16S rRNA (uracil(1498)-N(3))-methyltransferase n=1 Tax=Zhouia sp. PK063 TaxID=3373602 RepID=UPI003793A2B2
MQLFYSPDISENNTLFNFDKEESRHITKVLRKKIGDILHITNGKGSLFTAEIVNDNSKQCTIKIIKHESYVKKNYYIHLAVAPTKMNDRYEWFLEKATEIGIDEVTPIICDHSERKVVKIDRFEKILQSAMKQSLQTFLPQLNEPISFKDFIAQHFDGQKFIAHCEETERFNLKTKVLANQHVTILIGPEGDFSTEEISLAKKYHFDPVIMGNTRLRTETAAIVACHTIALLNN